MMRPMLINKGWNVCGCLMKLFAISTRYEQVHVFILDSMLLLNLIMCSLYMYDWMRQFRSSEYRYQIIFTKVESFLRQLA